MYSRKYPMQTPSTVHEDKELRAISERQGNPAKTPIAVTARRNGVPQLGKNPPPLAINEARHGVTNSNEARTYFLVFKLQRRRCK